MYLPRRHEEEPMTDQPAPHDQHDSELQLVLTIGIEGFRELVAWWQTAPPLRTGMRADHGATGDR